MKLLPLSVERRRVSARRSLLLTVAIGLSATQVQASTNGSGTISSIISLHSGQVLFNLSGSRSTPPSCSLIANRWAIDASTISGQAEIAELLTAYATGRQVQINGKGTCDAWPDTESVDFIETSD